MENIRRVLEADFLEAERTITGIRNTEFIDSVSYATQLLAKCIKSGGTIFIFGNGGSAADSQHIAAELMGRFKKERNPIRAISLTTDTSMMTAWSNDYCFDSIFERQIKGLASENDVVWGITTSGNSKNVLLGLKQARSMGVKTIALTGAGGGQVATVADCLIAVPSSTDTAFVQLAHMATYHAICGFLDQLMG